MHLQVVIRSELAQLRGSVAAVGYGALGNFLGSRCWSQAHSRMGQCESNLKAVGSFDPSSYGFQELATHIHQVRVTPAAKAINWAQAWQAARTPLDDQDFGQRLFKGSFFAGGDP